MGTSQKRLFKAWAKKASSQVRALGRSPTRIVALPLYRADLNHPVDIAEHGKAAHPARFAIEQTLPQGGSGGAALVGPKKQKPGCNVPDRPTSVWSEMAREQAEPHRLRRKQMTTDARRLMRPGVVAPGSTTQSGCLSVLPSCPVSGQRVSQ